MLIRVHDELIINADKIVTARFSPEKSGIDSESEKPFHNDAKLEVVTMALEMEDRDGYDGRIIGVAATSTVLKIYKQPAIHTWEILCAIAQ